MSQTAQDAVTCKIQPRGNTMKIKAIDVMNMRAALGVLSQTKLPAKISYRVGRGLNKVQSAINVINKEQHQYYKTHGILNEDKTQYMIPPGKEAEFQIEVQRLMDEEIEIDLHPICITDLEGISIEPAHLASLEGTFIVDAPAATATNLHPRTQSA
jgi:hypothetical protein